MNKKYDAEIETIQAEIKNIEEINLISNKQANNLQIYIDRIKSIVNEMKTIDMNEVYKRMVDKIIIYQDNILELHLACVPTPIKIQYECRGKNGNYNMKYNIIG